MKTVERIAVILIATAVTVAHAEVRGTTSHGSPHHGLVVGDAMQRRLGGDKAQNPKETPPATTPMTPAPAPDVFPCEEEANADILESDMRTDVTLYYELLTRDDSNVEQASSFVNEEIKEILVDTLILCDWLRRRRLVVQAVQVGPPATPLEGAECTVLDDVQEFVEGTTCRVMQDTMILYSSSEGDVTSDVTGHLFSILEDAFNPGTDRRLQGFANEELGIFKVYFLGGSPVPGAEEEEPPVIDEGPGGGEGPGGDAGDGAGDGDQEQPPVDQEETPNGLDEEGSSEDGMSGAGIGLLVAGLTVLFVLAAVFLGRKRRQTQTESRGVTLEEDPASRHATHKGIKGFYDLQLIHGRNGNSQDSSSTPRTVALGAEEETKDEEEKSTNSEIASSLVEVEKTPAKSDMWATPSQVMSDSSSMYSQRLPDDTLPSFVAVGNETNSTLGSGTEVVWSPGSAQPRSYSVDDTVEF